MNFYTTIDNSLLGTITLTYSNIGLSGVFFNNAPNIVEFVYAPIKFEPAIAQLNQYFAGKLKAFDLKLDISGTSFQSNVWHELMKIPFGQTRSYKDIATSLNKPTASRAVGMANSKNPLCIIIPCHRVIGACGKLIGYNGGLDIKQWLLQHENNYS
jgi:methylated-DNA-[protein]-cysteine S-methyltransferase